MKIWMSTIVLVLLGFTPIDPAQAEEMPLSVKEKKALVAEALELGSRAMGEQRARQLEIFGRFGGEDALTSREDKKWRSYLLEVWVNLPGLPETKGDNFSWEDERKGRYIVGGKSKKPTALMIGMHGGGVGSGDAGSSAGWYSGPAASHKWVAIFPEVLEKTERGWTDAGTEEWVWDLVEQARRSFGVDADHVYLVGHSMGGYGSWTLGGHHADRVAALAPSAGAPTPILDRATNRIVAIDAGVVPNLRNVPMVVYQSIDDPRVPPDANQFAVAEVAKAKELYGGYEDFMYWEVDGEGHGPPPGGPGAHVDKIQTFVREPIQDVVVWQPTLDWKRQFYWLFWEQPSPRATVIGRIDRETNTVAVEVKLRSQKNRGQGLAVLLDERLVDFEREVIVTLDGEEVFRGTPERRLEVLLDTSTSGDPGRQYSARVNLR
jgi:predicted alpha/beta hydrolase family esterase